MYSHSLYRCGEILSKLNQNQYRIIESVVKVCVDSGSGRITLVSIGNCFRYVFMAANCSCTNIWLQFQRNKILVFIVGFNLL